MKKPIKLYILDTGTELFAECENKENAYTMGCDLLENCWDHGYLDIYFLYNDNIEYYWSYRELCFSVNWEELGEEEYEKYWIKKIWELRFESKEELKTILFDL